MQRDYRGVLISITTQSVSGGYAVSFTLTIPDDDGSGSLTLSRSISHVFAEDGEALGDALMQAKKEIDEQYAL